MSIATAMATRSTCDRKHVGAVVVRDRMVISSGYNGSIRGLPHCDEEGHLIEDDHCVAGNTVISKMQTGHYNSGHRTIRQIYEQWMDPQKRGAMQRMRIRCAAPSGAIVEASIRDVWLVGRRETFRVTTFLGRQVTTTSDHRFLTRDGWIPLSDMGAGTLVALNGQPAHEDPDWLRARYIDDGLTVQKIAALIGVSRALIKRRLLHHRIDLRDYDGGWNRGLRRNDTPGYKGREANSSSARARSRRYALGPRCVLCEADERLEVHHIDGDHKNDADENLTTLCVGCHNLAHSPHVKVETVRYDRIKSIEPAGEQDVYDLTVHPYANFVGNGFVMHNCVRTVHAEANAIVQAARNGMRIDGATIYVTASPCWGCFRLVANAGITRVVFGEPYRIDEKVVRCAAELGIELVSAIEWEEAARIAADVEQVREVIRACESAEIGAQLPTITFA